MIVFAFAMPHEAEGLTSHLIGLRSAGIPGQPCYRGTLGGREIAVAVLGMGEKMACTNALVVLEHFNPTLFVLAGYGGGLVPELRRGCVVVLENHSSPEMFQRISARVGCTAARCVTVEKVVHQRKQREALAQSSGCQVVDMETAAVAAKVVAHGTPFLAVRVISDTLEDRLPGQALEMGWDAEKNCATPLRLLLRLLSHPGDILPFVLFVCRLGLIRKRLTDFLVEVNRKMFL